MDEKTQRQLIARLDRIPLWPYPYWVLFIIGIGFFFAFFDIVTIGLAIPVLTQQFHITTSVALWTITMSLIGYIIGSFLDSRLSDVFGRKIALFLSLLFFSVGSILSATSTNIGALIFWRLIIGMGIGSDIANATTYIGELSPASQRGRYTSLVVSLGFLGFAMVPFVGLLLIPNFTWGWRVLFALGGFGGLLAALFRRFIPDSIRWLVVQQRYQQAEVRLVEAEKLAEQRYKKSLPAPQVISSESTPSIAFFNLFHPPYCYRILFFAMLWFVYYLGNYAWLTLNTQLFDLGGYNLKNSLLLVALSSLGFILGSVLAIFFGDRWERKITVSVCALLWTIALLIIAWVPHEIIIMIFGFIAAATISLLIPLLYTLTAESFPTTIRATGVAITDGVGHLGGAFCGQIILGVYALTKATGYGVPFAFSTMALTALITTILVLFGTRMTGRSLE